MIGFAIKSYPARTNCYAARPGGASDVSLFVLHHTAGSGTAERVVDYLNSIGLSVHYAVDKIGHIVQSVPDAKMAYHAGDSSFGGREHCNEYSTGVEIVNLGNGIDPFPDAQVRAVAYLAHLQMKRHPKITYARITDHKRISHEGKIDMRANWPQTKFRKYLEEYNRPPLTGREKRRLSRRLRRVSGASLSWVTRLVRRIKKGRA